MSLLRRTCSLLGIQTSFYNDQNKLVKSSDETLRALIQLLTGHQLRNENDLRQLHNEVQDQNLCFPEVLVAWDGIPSLLKLRLSEKMKDHQLTAYLRGSEFSSSFSWNLSSYPPQSIKKNESENIWVYTLPWNLNSASPIPFGYHHIEFQMGSQIFNSLLISAPRRPLSRSSERNWGLFTPLYAVKSDDDWGIGSLKQLESVQEFLAGKGGKFLGTLPLLAPSKNKERFEPSPYSPSTRLFWNEIYLDIPQICEQMTSPLLSKSYDQTASLKKLRESRYVDYDAVFSLKKNFLSPLAEEFFKRQLDQSPEYLKYVEENPEINSYADFCGDRKYHRFVQFQFHLQLQRLFQRSQKKEIAALYLDYPVGVSADGFDAKHFSDVFLPQSHIGAPPDTFFKEGQNWGTVALHPKKMRTNNYNYFIKSLRNHLRYSSLLRLDHVMSLHRLYIIPEGNSAQEGAYLKFPFEELYAILCLESYHSNSEIIGEDLGTVSPFVREKLTEHNFQRMWVFELEYNKQPADSIDEVPKNSLAALNTHDMDPFFKFWSSPRPEQNGIFNEWLKYLGFSPEAQVSQSAVLSQLTRKIAASKAHIFLMNLEDLLEETEPQNTPGRTSETTWRKKNRLKIEEWTHDPYLLKVIHEVNEVRAP